MEVAAVNFYENEYRKRINEVMNYIDIHCNEALPLERLADIAGFSPFHFHRIFQSCTGENLHSYVKRIRMGKAAHQLLYSSDKTITDVAMTLGFNSSSSFTRAFKEIYGISPKKYRVKKNSIYINEKSEFVKRNPKPEYDEKVHLINLEDLHVAFIRTEGLSKIFRSNKIENAFNRLIKWGKARDFICPDTKYMGFMPDSPETIPLEKCRYLACITVPASAVQDGSVDVKTMPAKGKYMVYTFERTAPDFPKIYFETAEYLYGCFMPENGYVPDDKPFIEMYRKGLNPGTVLVDLHIPILPL